MQTRRIVLLTAVLGLIILSFSIPAVSATGPKHIRVSQTKVNSILKGLKIYNGPAFHLPKGSSYNFTCGSSGCAISFNEIATTGIENLINLGIGITGVATAVLALTGVGIPAAAVVGLVVAMFTATTAWIAVADWWGGNIGIYGSYWIGSFLFTIWCNPVPSLFLPPVTTTSTTQLAITTSSIESSTITQSTTVTTSSSTTTFTDSSVCAFGRCNYGPSQN